MSPSVVLLFLPKKALLLAPVTELSPTLHHKDAINIPETGEKVNTIA